jgi:hypothetical protein
VPGSNRAPVSGWQKHVDDMPNAVFVTTYAKAHGCELIRRFYGAAGLADSPGLDPIFDISRWRSASDSMVAHTVSPRVKN